MFEINLTFCSFLDMIDLKLNAAWTAPTVVTMVTAPSGPAPLTTTTACAHPNTAGPPANRGRMVRTHSEGLHYQVLEYRRKRKRMN